jgi:hypothetical protein
MSRRSGAYRGVPAKLYIAYDAAVNASFCKRLSSGTRKRRTLS